MNHEPRKPSIGKGSSGAGLARHGSAPPWRRLQPGGITPLSSLACIAFGQCPGIESAAFDVPISITCCARTSRHRETSVNHLMWRSELHRLRPLPERGRSNLCGFSLAQRHKLCVMKRQSDKHVESHSRRKEARTLWQDGFSPPSCQTCCRSGLFKRKTPCQAKLSTRQFPTAR